MIHRFTRPLLCCLLLFFVIVVRAEDGWGKIWQNKQELARTAFRAALSAHMDEARALFGLALLNESEGDNVGALQAWRRYLQMAPTSWPVFAYWPTMRHCLSITAISPPALPPWDINNRHCRNGRSSMRNARTIVRVACVWPSYTRN